MKPVFCTDNAGIDVTARKNRNDAGGVSVWVRQIPAMMTLVVLVCGLDIFSKTMTRVVAAFGLGMFSKTMTRVVAAFGLIICSVDEANPA
jgi:hypothetical protein